MIGKREKSAKRIMIVDDHPVVRRGLAQIIDQEPDLSICGQAENSREALRLAAAQKHDLAVVDLTLGDENGLELVKALKAVHRDMPVLVLSMHDESLYAERALRAGASGYIMKHEAAASVVAAVRKVLSGAVHVSQKVAARALGKMSETIAQSPLESLSDRELEVLRWVGQGFGTRQIAEKLCLSIKTIEAHRENIKRKLRVKRAPELVRYAVEWVQSGGQRG